MNTIIAKNYSKVIEEYPAAAAITPGHLIQLVSAGTVQKHATASGNAFPMFALEDSLQGKGIDEDYAAADRVQCWIPGRGDMVNAILKDGQSVVAGDFVESAGDGTLQKWVVDSTGDYAPAQIIGVVVTAVDMSGSSAVDPDGRVLIRIL